MKVTGICFSEAGRALVHRIADGLSKMQYQGQRIESTWVCQGKCETKDHMVPELKTSIVEWTAENFNTNDALIFIGAAGIAVRAIASFVRDKRHDPAVVVLDEEGSFVIPILAGHVGGANEFASDLAAQLSGTPVITTSRNAQNKFDVAQYAAKNNLVISNMTYAKEVSAALMTGEPVGFYTHVAVP